MHFAVLLAALFLFVMFLFMPFSVFGVKSRLEAIEARLDEIQGEIRSLSLRLPEPGLDDPTTSACRRARPAPANPARPAAAHPAGHRADRTDRAATLLACRRISGVVRPDTR